MRSLEIANDLNLQGASDFRFNSTLQSAFTRTSIFGSYQQIVHTLLGVKRGKIIKRCVRVRVCVCVCLSAPSLIVTVCLLLRMS